MTRTTCCLTCLALLLATGCNDRTGGRADIDREEAQKLYRTLLSGEGGGTGGGGTGQQRTGWASIQGTVKLLGDPPAPKRLTVNRDQETCAPGGAAVYSQDIVLGPNKELANLVIYARGVATDNVHPDSIGATDEVLFDQRQCVFLSHVQVMQKTQKLKILNSDEVGHNTNIQAPKAGTFNQNISGGGGTAIYEPVASEAQPAPVSCSIHPWMKAYLLPLDNAYGASTTKEGAFELTNLPAGVDVELQFWHELGSIPKVTINGKEVSLKRGRHVLKLNPDEKLTLDIAVSATAFK